jgi:tetratricopeptide (TPR) repeat protein
MVRNDAKAENDQKAEWNYQEGKKALQNGDFDLAISYLTESLRLRPRHAPALQERCRARTSSGKYPAAVEDAETMLLWAKDKKTRVFAYNARGLVRLCEGKLNSVVEDATEEIRTDPNAPEPYLLRAEAYLRQLRFQDSIRDASTAIRLDPKCALPFTIRGRAYLQERDFINAHDSFSRSINLQPTPEHYCNRAEALAGLKEWRAAIKDAQEAIARDSQSERGHFLLAWLYAAVGDNKAARYHSDMVKRLRATD